MKSRALFVDDEPMVLNGLRRMLRSLRHDWEMSFANSGQEALDLLDEQDFNVVVSDMRMPEMDGAALLNEVAARHPATARLVLSGHAELDAILRAVRPAHQFLAKPCDPKLLEQALQRINRVQCDHEQGRLCKMFGAHRRLPSPQKTIDRLRSVLSDTPSDLDLIGDIVSTDIALSIQVLRLVNSAFFGTPTKTFDPKRAVTILGTDMMKSLLDEVDLFRPVDASLDRGEEAVVQVNNLAQNLARDMPTPGAELGMNACILAMLALSGQLAAIETPEPLDDDAARSLSKVLLAFWGLDIDTEQLDRVAATTVDQERLMPLGA